MTIPEFTYDAKADDAIRTLVNSFRKQLEEMLEHHAGSMGRHTITAEDVRRFGFCIAGPSYAFVEDAEIQPRE
jgi:hypothetical protein